jgi:transcriptional regulator with XRE-family HTH domain
VTPDEADDLGLRRFLAGLRRRRERLGMTIRDVSRATGVNGAVISRLETGKAPNPTIRVLMKVARATGTPIVWPGPRERP